MVFRTNALRVLKLMLILNLTTPICAYADAKSFLVSLPVLTLGREGNLRAEYNLFEKGTLALEWTGWVGKGQREELTNEEKKENPGSSLRTEGREIGLMFGRYTDPLNMDGFNWGVGVGYRAVKAKWFKTPSINSPENKQITSLFDAKALGPTLSARLGYRFVGDSVGFAIGSFLGVKHFLNQVSDESREETRFLTQMSSKDRRLLQRKLATSLKIGLEIGWAF